MKAVEFGKLESLKGLLANGADINVRNIEGLTALDLSMIIRNEKVTRLLQKFIEK